MGYLINMDKIIQSCEAASLKAHTFQVPLAFLHNALRFVVVGVILKKYIYIQNKHCSFINCHRGIKENMHCTNNETQTCVSN